MKYNQTMGLEESSPKFPGGRPPPILVLPDEASSNTPTIRQARDAVQYHAINNNAEHRPLTLNHELRRARVKTSSGFFFWSEASLKRIVTEERIEAQLSRGHDVPWDLQQLTNTILAHHMKVYAILTMLAKHDDIHETIQQGVSDESLPLLQQSEDDDCPILLNGEILSCFSHWSDADRDSFMNYKHQVNPVLLGRDRDTVELDKSAILPIIHEEFVTRAGFGEVSRVQLHPECHTFRDVLPSVDTTEWFALKRLVPRERGDLSKQALGFKKEVDALQRLHNRPNQHIVTLLATWAIEDSVRDRYCLLFPWAEGDLKSYWQREKCPCSGAKMDLNAIQWVTKQILGMADALKTIHSPNTLEPKQKYGRHGDIKAENILWYPPSVKSRRGTLVIADLGLTEFKSTQSRSNVPGEGLSATPGYRPPECDLKGGTVSRAFDIWTYGCLLLEMVCWMLGGQKFLDEFEDHRMTPGIHGPDTDIFFEICSKGSRVSQNEMQLQETSESAYCKHAVAVKGEVHEVSRSPV
ncbi:hypothetical protein AA0120_g4141 [Alternaria tenuissima]|nr:hypothetical protein AA0120_g4141 [Alternaria tenuissima]